MRAAANKTRDKQIGRFTVELQGRADLLDAPVIENHDLVGKGHGFDLVVGNVDHCGLELLMELGDLQPHVDTQGGVEVGQGLVKQKGLRLAHDRPADRDPLALATGKLPRTAVKIVGEVENRRRRVDAAHRFVLVEPRHLQGEGDVAANRHVGIKRVGLEDHRETAFCRRRRRGIGPVDQNGARCDILEAGNEPEQRRLATAGRADKDDEFAVGDFEID